MQVLVGVAQRDVQAVVTAQEGLAEIGHRDALDGGVAVAVQPLIQQTRAGPVVLGPVVGFILEIVQVIGILPAVVAVQILQFVAPAAFHHGVAFAEVQRPCTVGGGIFFLKVFRYRQIQQQTLGPPIIRGRLRIGVFVLDSPDCSQME